MALVEEKSVDAPKIGFSTLLRSDLVIFFPFSLKQLYSTTKPQSLHIVYNDVINQAAGTYSDSDIFS